MKKYSTLIISGILILVGAVSADNNADYMPWPLVAIGFGMLGVFWYSINAYYYNKRK